MTLAVTLLGNCLVGYTINRVTLFALILSLGLLVDDPIVDVENIHRHFRLRTHPPREATLVAVDEVRPPTILATFTVIVSFLPMLFVTGMMGPYMRPMPFNVPLAMLVSLLVAFTVTPWAAYRLLRHEYDAATPGAEEAQAVRDLSGAGIMMSVAWTAGGARWLFLVAWSARFVGSVLLVVSAWCRSRCCPFDNKNEFQLVIDMPEGHAAGSDGRGRARLRGLLSERVRGDRFRVVQRDCPLRSISTAWSGTTTCGARPRSGRHPRSISFPRMRGRRRVLAPSPCGSGR